MKPYDREALGALLRRVRLDRAMTLKQVADAVGVYLSYVSDVEAGRTTITPERLDQFARILKIEGETYARLFRTRERLPPSVERHFLNRPSSWPRSTP